MEELKFLTLTILVESMISSLYLRGETTFKRILFATVCVNLISHPIAWYFFSGGASWLSVEICVTIFEMIAFAILFPKFRWKAVAAACAMNIVSALIGLMF